jgi:hypothetical protein
MFFIGRQNLLLWGIHLVPEGCVRFEGKYTPCFKDDISPVCGYVSIWRFYFFDLDRVFPYFMQLSVSTNSAASRFL